MMPGGHVVVALSGEIDIVTAPVTRDLLAEAAGEAVTGITVDIGGVTFLDAAGLGVLVGASEEVRHLPDGFRLVAVPARVLRLLRLTGLDYHLAAFAAPPCTTTRGDVSLDVPVQARADLVQPRAYLVQPRA